MACRIRTRKGQALESAEATHASEQLACCRIEHDAECELFKVR